MALILIENVHVTRQRIFVCVFTYILMKKMQPEMLVPHCDPFYSIKIRCQVVGCSFINSD